MLISNYDTLDNQMYSTELMIMMTTITISSHERMHPLLSKTKQNAKNQQSPDASNEMRCKSRLTQALPLASVLAS